MSHLFFWGGDFCYIEIDTSLVSALFGLHVVTVIFYVGTHYAIRIPKPQLTKHL